MQLASGTKTYPLGLQILAAVSSAAYAAILAILAALLTRRQRWIRRVQILVFAGAIGLAAVSILLTEIGGGGLPTGPLLVTILFLLLDFAAIMVMTERRVAAWYVEPAPVPWYASGTLGFWVATSLLLLVLNNFV